VDDNVLSGVLPDFWTALPALSTLKLDFNFFSGARSALWSATRSPRRPLRAHSPLR
jgi:hypothetical protein